MIARWTFVVLGFVVGCIVGTAVSNKDIKEEEKINDALAGEVNDVADC